MYNNWVHWDYGSQAVHIYDRDTLRFELSSIRSIGLSNYDIFAHLFNLNSKNVWNWTMTCTANLTYVFNVGFNVRSNYIDEYYHYFSYGLSVELIDSNTLKYKFIYDYHKKECLYSKTETIIEPVLISCPMHKSNPDDSRILRPFRYNRYDNTVQFKYIQFTGSLYAILNGRTIINDVSIQSIQYKLFGSYSSNLTISGIRPIVWGIYANVVVKVIDSTIFFK
jgi:hypothetical protein